MRQLASIQKIINLQPIEGKDKIELATILGWSVVVQKGEFNIDSLCVYIEPDTLLPEREEFEFLRKRCYSKKFGGFRIKVMKLGTTYSQGIVFPYSLVEKGKEGDDVSKELGIKAYDLDELTANKQIKQFKYNWFQRLLIRLGIKKFNKKSQSFPSFAMKSDETRLQAIPKVLDYIKDKEIVITEKLDGQSGFFFYHKGKTGVCSRNIWLIKNKQGGYDQEQFFEIEQKYDIINKLIDYCKKNKVNLGIQGEIIGTGIQGNKYKLQDKQFYIYQIQDLDTKTFLNYYRLIDICNELNLTPVPLLFKGIANNTIEQWINYSIDTSVINNKVQREGIVVRTTEEIQIPHIQTVNQRASFKVINPEFLLGEKDE